MIYIYIYILIEEIGNSLGWEEINEINVSELISILVGGNLYTS